MRGARGSRSGGFRGSGFRGGNFRGGSFRGRSFRRGGSSNPPGKGAGGEHEQPSSSRSQGLPVPSKEKQAKTWSLYFQEDGCGTIASLFGEDDEEEAFDGVEKKESRSALISRIQCFLMSRNIVRAIVSNPADVISDGHVIHMSWADLVAEQPNDAAKPPFEKHDMQPRPQLVLDCLAHVAHEDLLTLCPPDPDPMHIAARLAAKRLRVRIYERSGPGPAIIATPICDLKADKIGRLVKVRGNVIRASAMRPYVEAMDFRCPRCKQIFTLSLAEGRYQPPDSCPRGCGVKSLVPEHKSASTRDFQRIRLQETPEDNASEFYGRVPRTIEVELLDDLVDTCRPGDSAVVIGIVKSVEVPTEGGGFGRAASAKPKCMFLLYIEAISVHNATAASATAVAASRKEGDGVADATAAAFSIRDLRDIAQLHSKWNGKMFELLASSFCPTIFGHEVVKVGLALGLFGGSQKATTGVADVVGKRPDIHVLVVGDPGMGKSQMLTAAAGVAPRGVYVCGNTTSSSGLTVTVVKDANTGDFALEAGALVMGDQGCCCIDEFDKMGATQHQALLEAMEQQSISVAKAGIVCSLSARTAVLAAANPVSGHYNSAKTVCENLKLPANILSRFDLVFVLLDRPNERMDRLLSEHVMALHAGAAKAGSTRFGEAAADDPLANLVGHDAWKANCGIPLGQRLREAASRFTDGQLVPAPLLRKYVAYARAHVHPVLTSAARQVLDDFYLQLRTKQRGGDSVPVTTRQLESLIRLAEARARMDLREEVTRNDALDAVAVVQETIIYDTLSDLVGSAELAPETTRVRMGVPGPKKPSHRKVLSDFLSFLEHDERRRNSAVWTNEEMRDAFRRSRIQNSRNTIDELVDALNLDGSILKTAGGWKLGSSTIGMSQRC